MPDPIHQIDYAPPRRQPSWWNRRTAFFVVLAVAAIVSGVIVVPRVVTRALLLDTQAEIARSGIDGSHVGAATLQDLWSEGGLPGPGGGFAYAGLREASGTSDERLIVVTSVAGGIVVHVIEPATWVSQPISLQTLMLSPAMPQVPAVAVHVGRNDPLTRSRFTIPVTDAEKPIGHIVGHLLPDDSVTLDWEPISPQTPPE